jgi:K+/H+ antiporter YhaU regulatory subunit KhtT
MADLKQFAEQLVNLTVKEVNELATILKMSTESNQLLQL